MTASIAPTSSGPPSSNSVPSTFSIRVSENEQEVVLVGILRPFSPEHMGAIRAHLERAARNAAKHGSGTLHLNLKRLKHMNNVAFLELNRLVKWAAQRLPNLKIKLIISSVIPWAIRKFRVIAQLHPNVEVEVYDNALYPIQEVIEDDEFINVLRTQSKVVWAREREILSRHGLRPGMRVADIGCGLGDFAVAIQGDFRPEYVVGVDHSRPFLRYAQRMVREFGLENIEYQYGDAASLLLPDNSFDFVTCRLSLQVFHHPERILEELFRICKPGGRVYITNETMSHISGYPNDEIVRRTFQEVVRIGRSLGIELDIGIQTKARLCDTHLEDIRVDVFDINNMNTECTDFVKIVESWEYAASQVALKAGVGPDVYDRIVYGHKEYVRIIMDRRGFASWPICAGSGMKPFRSM